MRVKKDLPFKMHKSNHLNNDVASDVGFLTIPKFIKGIKVC